MQSLFQERANAAALCVNVLVPSVIDKAYTYAVPQGMSLQPGDYVTVPLGKREMVGVVWDEKPDANVPLEKLKFITVGHELPPMPDAHRHFIDWMARYTMMPRGLALKMALAGMKFEAVGQVGKKRAQIPFPCTHPDPSFLKVDLSSAQKEAAERLISMVGGAHRAVLLDGVTGAGKTETYFEAMGEALRQKKQVLILLPEIALSNAFTARFETRFGCTPALWHSSVSPGKRKAIWRGVATGGTKVVAGARSALFLPFADLGLIIVDEEHDPAYKQEEGTIYHARDMAVARAHMGQIPVVLVSATPSLETMANVWSGRYGHIILPERHGKAVMPSVHILDMKKDKPEHGQFIAPSLRRALQKNFEQKQQSLLFLNRRGYAPLTLCRACGHRMACPRCTAWLVEHKRTNRLHCHHCGHSVPLPTACPACGESDCLIGCGPGVERVLEEVKNFLPEARTVVLASDTAESPDDLRRLLTEIRDHQFDVIVGTQIIAKGHHFPHLTLVGVVDADLGLSGGDLRAAERTFQMLHQVGGRAGREERPGHVFIQTFVPGNKLMQALAVNDRDAFLALEAQEREAARMPPYARLAGIIVSGRDEAQVRDSAAALGRCAPAVEGVDVLGPAEAPFYRLRGNFRRRLLLRTERNINIQKYMQQWLAQIKLPSAVRVQTDIDPQSFF